jgi:hypothetical protein
MKKIITDMDYEDDVSFYQTSRIVKICFVVLMFLISVACLAGAFGYGIWTKSAIGDQQDMMVEYECLLRITKETDLTCSVNTAGLQDSVFRISLGKEYLEKIALKHITPEPCKVVSDGNRMTFCFAFAPGKNLHSVSFTTVAKKSGKITATIDSDRQRYSISQFIYP